MEHVAGGGEAHGVAAEQRVVGEVLGDHRLADAVGADEDDVGGLGEEVEGEEFLDGAAVDLLRPLPVEVGHGFEGAEAGVLEAPLEAAPLAFALPRSRAGAGATARRGPRSRGEQTEEAEAARAIAKRLRAWLGGIVGAGAELVRHRQVSGWRRS